MTVKVARRSRVWIIPFSLLVLLAGCYRGTRPPHIGEAAPNFTLQDSDRKVTLSDLRGKVVVLNFWASWCPPCIEETPSLVQMQQRLKDRGVTVLSVSIDQEESAYHRFLAEYQMQDLLTVRDPDEKSPSLYGTHGWPESYIIDPDGIVRRKFIGAVQWNQPDILQYLQNLAGPNLTSSSESSRVPSSAE
jgi:peroxiredoxin